MRKASSLAVFLIAQCCKHGEGNNDEARDDIRFYIFPYLLKHLRYFICRHGAKGSAMFCTYIHTYIHTYRVPTRMQVQLTRDLFTPETTTDKPETSSPRWRAASMFSNMIFWTPCSSLLSPLNFELEALRDCVST